MTTVGISRRGFLGGVAGAGVVLVGGARASARQGSGPYGPLASRPDASGLLVPEGFRSRIVARAGEPVGDTGYEWPAFPDGAAVFPQDDGGWIHVVNSEIPVPGDGGVSALRYDADGNLVDAYRILGGTQTNCAGGPTPWGTWLSGEEWEDETRSPKAGQVWECDPTRPNSGEPRPALGIFQHEAVAVDPENEQLYLTEDRDDGAFYRFTPDAYPNLSSGLLEVASVDGEAITWIEVPDPTAESGPIRYQVPEVTAFSGGEGCWFADGLCYFTTKGDNHVRAVDPTNDTMTVVYDGQGLLNGVDNITVEAGSGDLYVAEDGDDMQVVVITGDGELFPIAQVAEEPLPENPAPSEITGPVFSPDGTRLYFSSQRGGNPQTGITYEVSGPFRGPEMAASATTTTVSPLTTIPAGDAAAPSDDGDDDSSPAVPIAIGVGAAAVVVGGAIALRRRTTTT